MQVIAYLYLIKEAELITLINTYSYFGIAIYYVLLDFVSPLTDEVSLVAIAYLSKAGLTSKAGARVTAFLALYGRNYTLFILARNRTSWLDKLTKRHPDTMDRFHNRMEHKYFETILLLTFLPKVRILGPVVAGLGKESKTQGIFSAIIVVVTGAISYAIGRYFLKRENKNKEY